MFGIRYFRANLRQSQRRIRAATISRKGRPSRRRAAEARKSSAAGDVRPSMIRKTLKAMIQKLVSLKIKFVRIAGLKAT